MTKVTLKEGDSAFMVRANGAIELVLANGAEPSVYNVCMVALASKWDDDIFREEMINHFDQLAKESDVVLGDFIMFPGNRTLN